MWTRSKTDCQAARARRTGRDFILHLDDVVAALRPLELVHIQEIGAQEPEDTLETASDRGVRRPQATIEVALAGLARRCRQPGVEQRVALARPCVIGQQMAEVLWQASLPVEIVVSQQLCVREVLHSVRTIRADERRMTRVPGADVV